MPTVEYLRQQIPFAGGSLVLTWAGPSIFVPGQSTAALQPALQGAAVHAAGYIVTLSRDAFPEEPMASGFQPITQVGPGLSVFAGTAQNDPVFPYLENDVRGHWMPWGPGSAFARWAARVGVQHVYLAARKYAQTPNHPGRHLMPKVLEQAAQVFRADLVAAVQRAVMQ